MPRQANVIQGPATVVIPAAGSATSAGRQRRRPTVLCYAAVPVMGVLIYPMLTARDALAHAGVLVLSLLLARLGLGAAPSAAHLLNRGDRSRRSAPAAAEDAPHSELLPVPYTD